MKSGSLNLLKHSGPVQACNGIALPFLTIYFKSGIHERGWRQVKHVSRVTWMNMVLLRALQLIVFINRIVSLQHINLFTCTQLYLDHSNQWRTQEFCSGGGSTNSFEDRGQREQGSGGGSPLVRGSGGSCNFVKEISFHIVKFSWCLVI